MPHDTEATFDQARTDELTFALWSVSKELTRRYQTRLAPLDLTYTQYVVMGALKGRDECTVREIGDRVHLNSATLTPLLKRLEAHGHVTRTHSHTKPDNRATYVALTPRGLAFLERAEHACQDIPSALGLGSDELTRLQQLLRSLRTHLIDA